jgi:hypothetical protein
MTRLMTNADLADILAGFVDQVRGGKASPAVKGRGEEVRAGSQATKDGIRAPVAVAAREGAENGLGSLNTVSEGNNAEYAWDPGNGQR